jgi:hypothetical protein
MACAGAAAVFALARAGDLATAIGARIAAGALLCLVAALVLGLPRLVPLSLVLVGAAYAVYLLVDDAPLDPAAPVFTAAILVSAELAYWSLEERERVRTDPGEALRRVALLAAFATLALVLSGALLALADSAGAQGLAIDLLGAGAAAAALLTIVLYARRSGT